MDSKLELISQVVEAIKVGDITIKQIVKALLPPKDKTFKSPKPRQTKEEQKAYRKAWYEKNKEYVIAKETQKYYNKKLLQQPLTHKQISN
jgi:hypothetical protein